MARLGFWAASSLIDLGIWDGGLLFHYSILSKIVVEITLRCTGCEEKKFVSVNDLCALTQSKNRMIKDLRVYWRVTSDREH